MAVAVRAASLYDSFQTHKAGKLRELMKTDWKSGWTANSTYSTFLDIFLHSSLALHEISAILAPVPAAFPMFVIMFGEKFGIIPIALALAESM